LTLYQYPHPLAGLKEIGDVRNPLKNVVGAAFHEEEDVSGALLPTEEGLREGGDGEKKPHFMSMRTERINQCHMGYREKEEGVRSFANLSRNLRAVKV
jgi:hypothetical protein